MRGTILVFFGLVFGLVWMLSPMLGKFGSTQQPVEAQAGYELNAVSTNPNAPNWYAGETVLDREADGHFYANVLVDGMEIRFLVDTGASVIALTGQDALDLGVQWDETQIRQIGHGANGPVYGVPAVISKMELGGFSATDVQAAIIPEGLHVSLLGQSFLAKVGKVEIRDNQMVLGNAQ